MYIFLLKYELLRGWGKMITSLSKKKEKGEEKGKKRGKRKEIEKNKNKKM